MDKLEINNYPIYTKITRLAVSNQLTIRSMAKKATIVVLYGSGIDGISNKLKEEGGLHRIYLPQVS